MQTELYLYTNYRKFLGQYYIDQKASKKGFSYRSLAAKCGFSSPNFIKLVIDNQKNLTKLSVLKITKGLGLNQEQSEYFENMVFFEQSKDISEKLLFLEKLDAIRSKKNPSFLNLNEYEYLRHWYHPVLREIIDLKNFEEDPQQIAKKFHFPLTAPQVKAAIQFLIQSGILSRDEEGKLKKEKKNLATSSSPKSDYYTTLLQNYHREWILRAADAVLLVPPQQRNVSNTTLTLSKESFKVAVERIKALRYELLELSSADQNLSNVYQLNMNLFPILKNDGE